MALDIPPHHLLPVRPVVRPAGPQVERDVHALLAQQRAHADRLPDVRVLRTGRDDPLEHSAERSEVGLVPQIRQECQRVREVDVVVEIAVEPALRVERAGERDEAGEAPRLAEGEEDRVERAEGAPDRDGRRRGRYFAGGAKTIVTSPLGRSTA